MNFKQNIIRYATIFRTADAFSVLTRSNYLRNEIEKTGIFQKLGIQKDNKLIQKLVTFTADVIQKIVRSYVDASQSDLISWFYDQFKKQQKHLQDIVNLSNIQLSDFENFVHKQSILNFQDFKQENGSCIQVLQSLSKFKNINKQLPSQMKVKINDLKFSDLINFVQSNQNNIEQIQQSGQLKNAEKIFIPGISSYKVYRCNPPKDKSDWKNDPTYKQLHERFAKDASWCVVRGTMAYGSYLDSKWNFYILVTTSSNYPVLLMNFAQNSDGQIKDIHDGAFSDYDDDICKIIDYLCEIYKFDPNKAPDFHNYCNIKKIINNNIQFDNLKKIEQSNDYIYYKIDDNTFVIYNTQNPPQCKFYITNNYNKGSVIRLGNKKDKINLQIFQFLSKNALSGTIKTLLEKKIIQKQNGDIYNKALQYCMKAPQLNKYDFAYLYLSRLQVIQNVFSYQQAIQNVNNSSKIKQLMQKDRIPQNKIEFALTFIFEHDLQVYSDILADSKFSKYAYNMIKQHVDNLNGKYGNLGVYQHLSNCIVDTTNYKLIAKFQKNQYKILQTGLQNQQLKYFMDNDYEFPVFCLISSNDIDDDLKQKANEFLEQADFQQDLNEQLYNGDLQKPQIEQILKVFIKQERQQDINNFVENYSGEDSFEILYDYVKNSQNPSLIYDYLSNYKFLNNADDPYDDASSLIQQLSSMNAMSYIDRLDFSVYYIAYNVLWVYIQKNQPDDALDIVENYLENQDQRWYGIDAIISKYFQNNDIDKVLEIIKDHDWFLKQSYITVDNTLDVIIQKIVKKGIPLNEYADDLDDNIKRQFVYYIAKNGAVDVCKNLQKCYEDLDDDLFQQIYAMLLKEEALDILLSLPCDKIPSDWLDQSVQFFIENNRVDHVVPLLQSYQHDQQQNDEYSQIYNNVYDQHKDDYNTLFAFGQYQSIDESKVNMSIKDIFLHYINDYMKNKNDIYDIRLNIQLYLKYNKIDEQTLIDIIDKLLQIKLNQSEQTMEKFIYWMIAAKLLPSNKQMFNVLLKYHKISLIKAIRPFIQQGFVKDIPLNEQDLSAFPSNLLAQNLTVQQALTMLSDDQFIQKYMEHIRLDENQKRLIIDKRPKIMLDYIHINPKRISNISTVIYLMKKCVQDNIPIQLRKRMYDDYSSTLNKDVIQVIVQSFRTRELSSDDKKTLTDFANSINKNIKLSHKLIKLASLLIE